MPTWTGSFNKAGSPTLKIKIAGPLPGSGQEFEAIVDTGFTGFVSMPIVKAFPLGLLLAGTTSVTLADGQSAFNLTATGIVTVGNSSEVGVIILQGSSADMLLGMDFLSKFGRVLFIHPNKGVASLIDEKDVDKFFEELEKLEAAANAAADPPDDPPATP
ncbi:MAG: gag-polyprotein putative aspartyl protease [Blastocatellia bacterium]|jgi:predicted aspartyl protease|nr:gag-polyprotein putative aspartyl protease [Blastocatellia bacterium]